MYLSATTVYVIIIVILTVLQTIWIVPKDVIVSTGGLVLGAILVTLLQHPHVMTTDIYSIILQMIHVTNVPVTNTGRVLHVLSANSHANIMVVLSHQVAQAVIVPILGMALTAVLVTLMSYVTAMEPIKMQIVIPVLANTIGTLQLTVQLVL